MITLGNRHSGVTRRDVLRIGSTMALPLYTPRVSSPLNTMRLFTAAMSPDGSLIAFDFNLGSAPTIPLGQRLRSGLGLFEWQTGRLSRIPNPPGMSLGLPRFSTDGKHIAALTTPTSFRVWRGIARIRVSSRRVIALTVKDKESYTSVVFRPETEDLLISYIRDTVGIGLKFVDHAGNTNEVLYGLRSGFSRELTIIDFLDRQKVIFQAIGPLASETTALVNEAGLRRSDQIYYELSPGADPKIFRTTFFINGVSTSAASVPFMTVADGANVVVVAAPVRSTVAGTDYALFRLMDEGNLEKLSPPLGPIRSPALSGNGNYVAALADIRRVGAVDLVVLDLETGLLHETHLIQRLLQMPDFLSL